MDICKKCNEPLDQAETVANTKTGLYHIRCRYVETVSWHLDAPSEFFEAFTFSLDPENKVVTIKKREVENGRS